MASILDSFKLIRSGRSNPFITLRTTSITFSVPGSDPVNNVSYLWLRTGEAEERDPVDDRLIEWLRRNPEVARELRIRGGLD